jgi:hypothetical protein
MNPTPRSVGKNLLMSLTKTFSGGLKIVEESWHYRTKAKLGRLRKGWGSSSLFRLPSVSSSWPVEEITKNIKFVVRVSRGAARAPAYVQRIDPPPVQMTTNCKLALMMGKLTAETRLKPSKALNVFRS